MSGPKRIRSVAVIGAGASGAVTAAALKAEDYFERIRVFERRECAGGTWIYDAATQPDVLVRPGVFPPVSDPPLELPEQLPTTTRPSTRERYQQTPIYDHLTTNVPEIAMSYSDHRFPYGPFVPHHIPREYVESYFSNHGTDSFLELNTTVEDLSEVPLSNGRSWGNQHQWKLTLRRYDPLQDCDIWWEDTFDAVILANGHYTVPYVPRVKGINVYLERYPGRIIHSKTYRSPSIWTGKRVLVIGNSASGTDVTNELVLTARLPVYQSRRSKSRWDGDTPPKGIEWKPTVKEYLPNGRIVFSDETFLDDVDVVIYCTGYKASFPFWNTEANGRPLYDYRNNKLVDGYLHTFFQSTSTLGIVGMPRVLTFRGMEYQAIALARLFADRLSVQLPSLQQQRAWENGRMRECETRHKKFHDISWEDGETYDWFTELSRLAGLGTLYGDGRLPPVLSKETIWAIENVKKYPEHGRTADVGGEDNLACAGSRNTSSPSREVSSDGSWVFVDGRREDLLSFI